VLPRIAPPEEVSEIGIVLSGGGTHPCGFISLLALFFPKNIVSDSLLPPWFGKRDLCVVYGARLRIFNKLTPLFIKTHMWVPLASGNGSYGPSDRAQGWSNPFHIEILPEILVPDQQER